MKIAVTGGSGFIGTRLIEMLEKEGHECIIIDIVHEKPIDILDQEKLNNACAGCDVIYHLAAAQRQKSGLGNADIDKGGPDPADHPLHATEVDIADQACAGLALDDQIDHPIIFEDGNTRFPGRRLDQ